jgi:hypothetical protein
MKTLLTAAAAVATLALAGPVSAQIYQPMNPAPTNQTYQGPMNPGPVNQGPMNQGPVQMNQGPVQTMQQPTTISGAPSWTRDDGSSSDHPIHNPGDHSGEPLNSQYNGGITVPPGNGFPAR